MRQQADSACCGDLDIVLLLTGTTRFSNGVVTLGYVTALQPITMKNHRTVLILVGLLLTLGFPALPISRWENEFASVGHLVGYEIIWWLLVASILLYVRLAERRPLASIGFRGLGVWDFLLASLAGVVVVSGLAGIYFFLFPALHLNESQQMSRLIATPFWWRFVSVIRAAVGEEILFRGYAIERLQELSGSRVVAGTISCLVFTLEHVGPW